MLSGAEASLYTLFTRIAAIDQLARSLVERGLPQGLTLAQFAVLSEMGRTGQPATPLALATALGVTKQTMTTTVARLARRGCIDVAENPADRRCRPLRLTADGRATLAAGLARLGPDLALAADAAPDELVRSLSPGLAALQLALQAVASGAATTSAAPEQSKP